MIVQGSKKLTFKVLCYLKERINGAGIGLRNKDKTDKPIGEEKNRK